MRQHHPSATISAQSEFVESITSHHLSVVLWLYRERKLARFTKDMVVDNNDNQREINGLDRRDEYIQN